MKRPQHCYPTLISKYTPQVIVSKVKMYFNSNDYIVISISIIIVLILLSIYSTYYKFFNKATKKISKKNDNIVKVTLNDSKESSYILLLDVCSFIIPFTLYYNSTPSSVYLVDSGSLTLATHLPGVPHPSGFPAAIVLGWLWSKIPVPLSVSHKCNLFSGLWGSICVHYVWKISRNWIKRSGVLHSYINTWIFEIPAICGATLCMFMWPIWMYSTITEVYTITAGSLLLSIYCVTKWQDIVLASKINTKGTTQSDFSEFLYLIVAGTMFGVAGCGHIVAAALAFPTLCFMVIMHQPSKAVRNILICGIPALSTGLFFYGLLFIISLSDPLWCWGGNKTLIKLWEHITGKMYSVNLFGENFNAASLKLELWRLLYIGLFSVTPAGFLVAWSGMFFKAPQTIRSAPSYYDIKIEKYSLIQLTLIGTVFSFAYIISEDKEGYFVTSCWALAISYSIGLSEIFCSVFSDTNKDDASTSSQEKKSSKRTQLFTLFVAISVPLLVGYHNYTRGGCYRPDDHRATTIVKEVASVLPKNSLLFTKEFQYYSPWLYLHHIENFRKDLIVVDLLLARRSWYLDYLQKEAPKLMSAVKNDLKLFRKEMEKFEDGRPYDGNYIEHLYKKFLNAMAQKHIANGNSVFYMPQLGQRENGIGDDLQWIPWGLVQRGVPSDKAFKINYIKQSSTILNKYDYNYPWVRHPWDIEGWKLAMLYGQAVAHYANVWKILSNNYSPNIQDTVTKFEADQMVDKASKHNKQLTKESPYNVNLNIQLQT